MKKIFLLLSLVVLGSISFAERNIVEVRGGYDLSSSTKFKDDGLGSEYDFKKFVKQGLHLGVEYRREVLENFQIGAGIEYRLSEINQPSNERREVENIDYSYDSGNLTSVPLYVTTRYNFKNSSAFTPYVKANLGYSMNSGEAKTKLNNIYTGKLVEDYKAKIKSGMFYGLGTGIEYKNFLVDLSYDITYSKVDNKVRNYNDDYNESDDYKFNIKKLTLSVGYQFGF